jgi:DNA-binding transcriptional LysR family regulator
MYLDLVKLRSLVELRNQGTMVAAAGVLGYTTGAISQQISALEAQVGYPLLIHSGRQVELTDAGVVLAREAVAILDAERNAREAVAALEERRGGQVRVGVFGTAAAALLPPALSQLRRCYPDIVVHSVEVDVDAATAAVASHSVDLAFGVDYPDAPIPRDPAVTLLTLRTESFKIALSDQETAPPDAVPLSYFAEHSWLLPPERTHYGLALRMACRRTGFEPQVNHEVTDTAATLAMAAAGMGVAPVTDLMLQLRPRLLETVTLTEPVQRVMVLAHRHHPVLQPGLQSVIEAIQETVLIGIT